MGTRITAPHGITTGIIAGVMFRDGQGTTTDPEALAWFKLQGWDTRPEAGAATSSTPAPAEAPRPAAEETGLVLATTPPDDEDTRQQDGDTREDAPTPPQVARPRPSASKAEWFEYVNTRQPGTVLEVTDKTRAELITIADNLDD